MTAAANPAASDPTTTLPTCKRRESGGAGGTGSALEVGVPILELMADHLALLEVLRTPAIEPALGVVARE
jgi:hypothetical protein